MFEPNKKLIWVLLIPVLTLNLGLGMAKSCDTNGWGDSGMCCKGMPTHDQVQGPDFTSKTCACQIIESNAQDYVALLKDASKPTGRGNIATPENSSFSAIFVSEPDQKVYKFSKSTQSKSLRNLAIYDFLSSYLI